MAELRSRLRRTRWPEDLLDSAWRFGTNPAFMREICDYWVTEFDWGKQIERFQAFPHFKNRDLRVRRFTSFTCGAKARNPFRLSSLMAGLDRLSSSCASLPCSQICST